MTIRRALLTLAALIPAPALAVALNLPSTAHEAATRISASSSVLVATGPWRNGAVGGISAEGTIRQTAWKIDFSTRTTLQLLAPLREQLAAQGYETLFECMTEECGGFDFRHTLDILPEPEMHVDLGDFRYLSTRRDGPDGPDYLTLLVSRSPQAGFVQVTRVGAGVTAPEIAPVAPPQDVVAPDATTAPTDLAGLLLATGHAALDDLVFETGAAALGPGPFPSLIALADWLTANPGRTVTLVGHTDAEGALDANIALSKKRAAAVRDRLTADFSVPAAQVAADGVGYLAPRADNLTEEGRQKNRRVEVVLTSTR